MTKGADCFALNVLSNAVRSILPCGVSEVSRRLRETELPPKFMLVGAELGLDPAWSLKPVTVSLCHADQLGNTLPGPGAAVRCKGGRPRHREKQELRWF